MSAQHDIAAARSRTYWLLSRLLLEQPDRELLRELVGAADSDEDREQENEVKVLREAAQAALASQSALTDLQVEYTRLLGSASKLGGAPEPYESVAREGRLFGASAEAVAARYADAGHQDLILDTGPPDHLGTELRFLALLCYREMQAWEDGDPDEAKELLDRQRAFLMQHVLAWAPAFCESLDAHAGHPFYAAVARLTAGACTGAVAQPCT